MSPPTPPQPPPAPPARLSARLVPLCAVLAAAIASAATAALPPPPVLYPRAFAVWQFDRAPAPSAGPQPNAILRERAACAELVGAVTRSGKEGLAVTLRAVPDDPGTPCPLDRLRATLTLTGGPTVEGEVRALESPDGGPGFHDVVFAFDNNAAWNAGQRRATLHLSGLLAGEPFAFEALPMRHARPGDHLALPNPHARGYYGHPRRPDQAPPDGDAPAPVTTSPFQGAPR